MNKIEELEGKIAELSNELEKLKREKDNVYDPNWIPELNEDYWFVNSLENVEDDIWIHSDIDYFRKYYLKIFKTKEEAERYLEHIQAKRTYSYEFSLEEWEDTSIVKYSIGYDFKEKRFIVSWSCCVKYGIEPLFKTEQKALEFINKYEKQILKYDIGIMEE